MLAWLLPLLFLTAAEPSPLLDYHKMEELKNELVQRTVLVGVKPKEGKHQSKEYMAERYGQGVCVQRKDQNPILLVSQFLIEDARTVRVRTRQTKNWHEAKVKQINKKLAVAILEPPKEFSCVGVELAPDENVRKDALVFSVDNPLQGPTVHWGFVAMFAEPPLTEFVLTTTGLALSYPLFDSNKRLLALNLRPYTPTSQYHLAVCARQLRALLTKHPPKKAPSK